MMPTVQMLAAVAWPVVKSPCLMIAPAPMNPMPVTMPCMIFAFTAASAPNTDIAVCTRPQAAMATRGKVRRPAPCSSRARCHPIGNARTNATSKWTRCSRLSSHTPKMLGISFSSHGELGHHAGILVLQNVTVRHIRSGSVRRMREAHQDFGYTVARDRGDVFPAGSLRFRRLAVPREDAELTAMDVNWV